MFNKKIEIFAISSYLNLHFYTYNVGYCSALEVMNFDFVTPPTAKR